MCRSVSYGAITKTGALFPTALPTIFRRRPGGSTIRSATGLHFSWCWTAARISPITISSIRAADFDRYRETEADWLKGVVASEEFRQAPLRIVLLHIPPLHYDWHGGREIQRLFMPLLQGAGVDLMLCGHLHKAFYTAARRR